MTNTDEFLQWMEDEYSMWASREEYVRMRLGYIVKSTDTWQKLFWQRLVFQMAIETYKKSVREKEKQSDE